MRIALCLCALIAVAMVARPCASQAQDDLLTAEACDGTDPWQQWDVTPDKNGFLTLRAGPNKGYCLDITNYATADESPMHAFACHPQDTNPAHQNQVWTYNSSSLEIIATGTAKGMRVDLSNFGQNGPGSLVWIYHSTGATNQQWRYDPSSGLFKSLQTAYPGDLCISANPRDGPLPQYPATQPCTQEPLKSSPACDTSLDLETRVESFVSQIPLNAVVSLFDNQAASVSALNLGTYNWWSEALHGVLKGCFTDELGQKKCASSFPAAITTSMSFNDTLFHIIGDAIGTEARVYNNYQQASLTFWTPNINIFRDPRWGRGQETPGEDPTLSANYAAEFVSGFQTGPDPTRLKASSCCKHYAAYSLESWGGETRHTFNAQVTQQDLTDTYFPAFMSCANRANASGIMCSYNSVNGIPSCANKELLTDNMRNAWGFNGYITSDCDAVSDVYNTHHYTKDPTSTVVDVLTAGMDQDCGNFLGNYMQAAIDSGNVNASMYTPGLKNMFRVLFRLGMFDPDADQMYRNLTSVNVDSGYHRQLTLEAARQGMTLLKNNNNTLPFAKGKIATVAAVGPNADATTTMQSNYYGTAPYLISPIQGLASYATVDFQHGCDIDSTTTSGFSAAVASAQKADATVIIVGLDQSQEAEGHDRINVTFPGVQEAFIKTVAAAAKGPVVLVVMAGGALDLTAVKANNNIDAILYVGYPGQSGGQAIAETLFGDNNPSGRLTQTFYPYSYLDECSMFDMNMRPDAQGCPGRTHRFYTGPTVFNFGDGMSYTTFEYSTPALSSPTLSVSDITAQFGATEHHPQHASTITTLRVSVTNTGNYDGSETVLAFVIPPGAGEGGRPIRSLRRYTRLGDVRVGETREVMLSFTAHDFVLASTEGVFQAVAGDWTIQLGNEGKRVGITVVA